MNPPAPHFTAAQIALALGRKRQAVQRMLADVPPSGSALVSGNVAHTWIFSALPLRLQAELKSAAESRGHRNAEALLLSPAELWQPPFPLQQMRAQFVSRALKLRDALAAPLARQHTLGNGELAELGLREFSRVCGYTIGAKQWNRLFDRTVSRDRGFEQWQRAELYLDDAAFQKPIAKVAAIARQFDHASLKDTLATLENKEQPTTDDRAHIFHNAFSHFEALLTSCAARADEIAAKASVIAFLFSAVPGLSKSLNGLRRTFEIKLSEWRAADRSFDSLRDQRALKSGNFRAHLCDDCRQVLLTIAIAHDGNESMAYRLARREGLLCEACISGHTFNVRVNKSAVPKSVRAEITPLVDSVLPLHRGPHEAKMRGPYIMRDWSRVLPGDWFSGDDITWNHYYRATDGSGNATIMRGECLLMIDLRTGYPLDFSLISGHYNSEHIRGLILHVHDRLGLPHNGFYFERSAWAARLIDGDRKQGETMHWRETELGLRERGLNLDVRHATTPRAKTIEGLIHILQDRMRSIPGFVGFNERLDKRERVQKLLSQARAGNDDALRAFPTVEEWRNTIRAVLHEFAHDPQNGKMLPGVSPAEAWNEHTAKRPLNKLPDDARYILATHKKAVRVRQEGIVLTIRGQRMLFANDRTGELPLGTEVLARYNVECPELLTVSDMNLQNHFTVKRIELPAMSATGDQFAAVNAQVRGHRAHAKAIYGSVRHDLVSTIARDSEHDDATRQLGRFHNEAVEQHRAEKNTRTKKLRKIQTTAALTGALVPANVRNPDRVLSGIELEQQARARIAAKMAKGEITP